MLKDSIDKYLEELNIIKYNKIKSKLDKCIENKWDIKILDCPSEHLSIYSGVQIRFVNHKAKWDVKRYYWSMDRKFNKRNIYEITVPVKYMDYTDSFKLEPDVDFEDVEQLKRISGRRISSEFDLYNDLVKFIKDHFKYEEVIK